MAGARALGGRPAGDVGLAQLGEDGGREPRPVVADLHADGLGVIAGGDQDLAAGEVEGVLDDGGQGVEGLRPAPHIRSRHAGRPGHQRLGGDGGAALVRLDQLANELQQAHPLMGGVADFGGLGEIAQDVATALGLLEEEVGVVAQRSLRRLAGHLLGDDRDGGQGRAQFMGRRRRQRAEGRKALLARQHGLGDVEGELHLGGLAGRPMGVAAGEGDADQQGVGAAGIIWLAQGQE